MEQGCRVELDELHVFDCSFGTVHHCDAVACSDQRVGRVAVDRFASACSHDRHFGQERVHLAGVFVQHVCTVTFDARRMAGDDDAQMMLRDDLYRKWWLNIVMLGCLLIASMRLSWISAPVLSLWCRMRNSECPPSR